MFDINQYSRYEEIETRRKANNQKEKVPEIDNTSAQSVIKAATDSNAVLFITCANFFQQVFWNGTPATLLIDCRPSKDFESSQILYNNQINIPEDSIKTGYESQITIPFLFH